MNQVAFLAFGSFWVYANVSRYIPIYINIYIYICICIYIYICTHVFIDSNSNNDKNNNNNNNNINNLYNIIWYNIYDNIYIYIYILCMYYIYNICTIYYKKSRYMAIFVLRFTASFPHPRKTPWTGQAFPSSGPWPTWARTLKALKAAFHGCNGAWPPVSSVSSASLLGNPWTK